MTQRGVFAFTVSAEAHAHPAGDLLMGDTRFAEEYTEEEKVKFEKYLEGQIAKIDLPNKDIPFLRNKILTMYANPLINYLEAAKG